MGTKNIAAKIRAIEKAKGMGAAKPPTAGEIQERFFTTIGLGGLILGGLLILYTIYVEGDRNALYDASLIFSVVLLVVLLVILGREKKWFQWEKAVARMADFAEALVRPEQVKKRQEKQERQQIKKKTAAEMEEEQKRWMAEFSALSVPASMMARADQTKQGSKRSSQRMDTSKVLEELKGDTNQEMVRLAQRFERLTFGSGTGGGDGDDDEDPEGMPPAAPTGEVRRSSTVGIAQIAVPSGLKGA